MASLTLLLTLLSMFVHVAPTSRTSCTPNVKHTIRKHLNEDPTFCITHATRFRAASVLELSDGDCHMFGQCSLSTNTNPVYRRVRLASTLPLLKISLDLKQLPMEVLDSDQEDYVQLNNFGESSHYTQKYLSPLVGVTPTPFSSVKMLLKHDNIMVANLTFKTIITSKIQKANWFSKKYLQTSHPWNSTELSAEEDVEFNLYDDSNKGDSNNTCQFLIGEDEDTCFSEDAIFYIAREHYFVKWQDTEKKKTKGEIQLMGTIEDPENVRFYHLVV